MKYITTLLLIAVISVLSIAGCEEPPVGRQTPVETQEPAKPAESVEPEKATDPVEVALPTEQVEPEKTVQAQELPEPVKALKPGQFGVDAAPLTDMIWVKGEPVEFKKGNIYIVEFWATWCPPCKASIPHLTELQKNYKDKNVTVIGITNEKSSIVKNFLAKWDEKMQYTVAIDVNGNGEKNYSMPFKQRYIPHAFIVDADTKVVWLGSPAQIDPILDMVVAGTFDHVEYARKQEEQKILHRKLRVAYNGYFNKIISEGPSEEARKIAIGFIEIADSKSLNSFAWDILTNVPKEKRQIDVAIDAAYKANTMTFEKNPSVMDTYALALFEGGKVAQAAQMQQKAIDLLGDQTNIDRGMSQRLEKYKNAAKELSI